jgi:hypothetical protein
MLQIPNSQIQQAFLTGPYAIEKHEQFDKLLQTGTDAAIGSATNMASAAVVKELTELREKAAEAEAWKVKYMTVKAKYDATRDEVSIFDAE